jgi:NAD-dependent deacetylase
MSDSLHRARSLLAGAQRIVVLTGAGVSAESGVPTFRGAQGLWKQFRPEELATPQAFAKDPRLVWEWYGWRREQIATCQPNAGHLALARLALGERDVRIVTQNVDELHADAARTIAAERNVTPEQALPLELHGSIWRLRCTKCGVRVSHRDAIDASDISRLPQCERCAALMRPDVVWFGESLDPAILGEAFKLAGVAQVCLVVGTSGVVQPAASLSAVTLQEGGVVIEVNSDTTPLTPIATISIRARAAEVLPEIT